MTDIHPYMAFMGDDPSEGAILVFAHTSKEARSLAWPHICEWGDYIDLRVRRMREHMQHLMSFYDPAHPVIDDMPTCPVCEMWGAPIREAGCDYCAADLEQSP